MLYHRIQLTIPLFLFVMVLFTGCKKSENNTHTKVYSTLKIVEEKTGKPVVDAIVSLLSNCRCSYFGGDYRLIQQLNTDNNGEIKFEQQGVEVTLASHPKYWRTAAFGVQNLSMIPEAWQRVHLKKSNSYQLNAKLYLFSDSKDALPYVPFDLSSPLELNIIFTQFLSTNYLPADTTVYLRSLGNHNDYISCTIASDTTKLKDIQSPPQLVNAFDTVNVQIDY